MCVCVCVCGWVGGCVCNMCIYISISLVSAMKRNFQTGF